MFTIYKRKLGENWSLTLFICAFNYDNSNTFIIRIIHI